MNYQVHVEREGRWWMIHVPTIDGLTQARRISEIEDQARSLIAVSTDTPADSINIDIVSITVPEIGDLLAKATKIATCREAARRAEAVAAESTAYYAKQTTLAGIPVRDIAELLQVSPQRVSQLANT